MNGPIKEFDVVALTSDIPESNLVSGQVGTVVEVYDSSNYEVEFVDNDGQTYGLLPLKRNQIMTLHYSPVS